MPFSGVKVDCAHLYLRQVLWVVRNKAVADMDELLLEDAYHKLRDKRISVVHFQASGFRL